jgi:hypothetical protein
MRTVLTLSLLLSLALVSPAESGFFGSPQPQQPQFNAGLVSRKIQVGMTEAQLTNAIGWQPNKAEMQTCGGNTAAPWQCKILTFGGMGNELVVYMVPMSNSDSVVNNWTVEQW